MKASLVIPVLNEDQILRRNTGTIIEYLDENLDQYEIILVENGSSDNTETVAAQLCAEYPQVRSFSLPEPCLGEALKTGVINARFEKIVYYPIDLSVNLDFIETSVKLLDRNDIVVGSKRLLGACRSGVIMAESQETKFVKLGLSAEIASALVTAELTTPKLVKAASAEDLEDAVGSENVATVETRFDIQRE